MKRNIIAIAVLAALGVAAFLVLREPPDRERQAARAAIGAVPAERLDRVEIRRNEGSGATLREESIVLVRKDGAWRMEQPVDYALNPTSAERMVEGLAGLKVVDLVAENKAKHHVLEVDDELGVEVKALAGGEVLAHFIVGVSRNNMTYVRLPGKDEVYRIAGSHRATFNKSAKNLRDKTILKFDDDSVSRIAFANAAGELVLERRGEGAAAAFVPVGVEIRNFDERKAGSIAKMLTSLAARDFVDGQPPAEETGLSAEGTRVVFDAKKDGNPVQVTLWLGRETEQDRNTHLKTSLTGEQVFLVSSHMVKRLEAKADDFARTDEELAKEEERRKKAEEVKAAGGHEHGVPGLGPGAPQGMMPPAMGGQPGGQQIPPEVMEKIRKQMEKSAAQTPPPSP
jgi:hypothetical protein